MIKLFKLGSEVSYNKEVITTALQIKWIDKFILYDYCNFNFMLHQPNYVFHSEYTHTMVANPVYKWRALFPGSYRGCRIGDFVDTFPRCLQAEPALLAVSQVETNRDTLLDKLTAVVDRR
ncbi:hypothetical protein BaRGS_00014059 [Batillaria attramentaria]|uniref:Uncharacterized protein n=1 Tax=Batillaria attramentaria TaxID=370345 RepID=A0ABD0L5X1_9CAEN